jgi:hypothetical protein
MRNPRTSGAGIIGAKANKSLRGDNQFLPHAGPKCQYRFRLALNLDRLASALLFSVDRPRESGSRISRLIREGPQDDMTQRLTEAWAIEARQRGNAPS